MGRSVASPCRVREGLDGRDGMTSEAPREPRSGRGVRFFSPGADPGFRRRRLLFLWIYLAVVVGVVTPAVPGVWAGSLGWFGVPVSFLWVIALLAVVFVSLVWLFRSEPPEARIASLTDDGSTNG